MDLFTEAELRKAIQNARSGKSCKSDDLPVEFFKALAKEPGDAVMPILNFCSKCWVEKSVAAAWSTAA
eukprot:1334541-Lingulodinium_polyedra.AAC.1